MYQVNFESNTLEPQKTFLKLSVQIFTSFQMMLLNTKIFLKNKQAKKPLRRKDVSSWLFEESVIAYSITDLDS